MKQADLFEEQVRLTDLVTLARDYQIAYDDYHVYDCSYTTMDDLEREKETLITMIDSICANGYENDL